MEEIRNTEELAGIMGGNIAVAAFVFGAGVVILSGLAGYASGLDWGSDPRY